MDAIAGFNLCCDCNDKCVACFSNGATEDMDEHEPRWFVAAGFSKDPSQI
jgi:hypothetical protein